MTIKCLAIDDEPLALGMMSGYISKTPFLELIGACRSGFDAFELISANRVDLLFVDINMPDINGLDFVKSLKDKPKIIFTTAFSEYAVEGFKLDALDYLLKPIGYNDFLKAANKARDFFNSADSISRKELQNEEYLFVKSEYKIIRLSLKDIIYIEGMREYVRIHQTTGKSLMPLISLRSLEEQLPKDKFMRVHRSYIVNLEKITTVEHNRIIFEGKVYIPVSDQYKEFFHRYINLHSLG
jgi:two-component system, LytTR family, response regulator LytT